MARILVTGTAGFIANHVAAHMLAQGHEVVGVDNFNDYYPVRLKEERHRLLEDEPNYVGHRFCLTEKEKTEKLVREGGFDVVCHLAAQPGVRYSITHPHSYIAANVESFLHILEGCRHSPQKPRLVYASSSSVYGGLTELPFAENQRVDTPISLYAATKKCDELFAHTYSHLYGMQTVGLRFFTVYGPWARPDMMMWIFTEAIHYGLPLKLFGEGQLERSFTDVSDIVAGVHSACFSPSLSSYEVFNLGNDKKEKVINVVEMMEEALGKKANRLMMPSQPGDMQATWANVDYAREKLGFEPKTSFRQCLEKFVTWFKGQDELTEMIMKWRQSANS